MEKLVLVIDSELMVRQLFDVLFKKHQKAIYTLDSLENNLYLLNDLRPRLIIFDRAALGQTLNELLDFAKKENIPTVEMLPLNSTDSKSSIAKFTFTKPLIISDLLANIDSILSPSTLK
jgi:DNA-binding response OmpR family regulator